LAGPDYNYVGIDQRGLGRSHPTFANPNCTIPYPLAMIADDESEEETRAQLKKYKERTFKCWKDK
jgi:pimeloyl-ACP methyl ester carboxylesterase